MLTTALGAVQKLLQCTNDLVAIVRTQLTVRCHSLRDEERRRNRVQLGFQLNIFIGDDDDSLIIEKNVNIRSIYRVHMQDV